MKLVPVPVNRPQFPKAVAVSSGPVVTADAVRWPAALGNQLVKRDDSGAGIDAPVDLDLDLEVVDVGPRHVATEPDPPAGEALDEFGADPLLGQLMVGADRPGFVTERHGLNRPDRPRPVAPPLARHLRRRQREAAPMGEDVAQRHPRLPLLGEG